MFRNCHIMMSERDISQGCKQGIASAQRALFDMFSPQLMATIFRYVGDDDDAKDVLQDTFITIYGTIHSFHWEGDGSLRAWVTRIAVNKSLNFLRHKKRLKATTVPVETLSDQPDDVDEETTQEVASLSINDIMEMIAELPDGYRTIFNLYCLDGFSHQEIAQQLGISEKTSSSQLSRAKALLARKIKQRIKNQEQEYDTTRYEQRH